jgi:hypothetical protein
LVTIVGKGESGVSIDKITCAWNGKERLVYQISFG